MGKRRQNICNPAGDGAVSYTHLDSKVEKTDGADVVIEVAVPAQVDASLSKTDCETILNKKDTIAVYGSNQHSGEAMVSANETLQKFGTGEDQVIGVAFDSGKVIMGAVENGTFLGAITQAPVAMGEKIVELLYAAANGETCLLYTSISGSEIYCGNVAGREGTFSDQCRE